MNQGDDIAIGIAIVKHFLQLTLNFIDDGRNLRKGTGRWCHVRRSRGD